MAKNRESYGIRIMIAAVVINLCLFFFKYYVSVSTASICIYTDALNNLFDSLFCIVAIFGFYFAKKGKSKKFPLGFGRAEYLANFIISAVLVALGCIFLYNCISQLMYPVPVSFRVVYAYTLGLTVFVKIGMGIMFSLAGRKCDSGLIKSMRFDSFCDAAITSVTVISYILCTVTRFNIDAFLGIVISVVIIVNAVKLLVNSIKLNLGGRNDELEKKISDILTADESVLSVENILIYDYGKNSIYASCTVQFSKPQNTDKYTELQAKVFELLNIKITFG